MDNITMLSTGLSNSSPYYLGSDMSDKFISTLSKYEFDKIYFVTDNVLNNLYAGGFFEEFKRNQVQYEKVILPVGEKNKSFSALETLCEDLIRRKISKDSIIIAFGGGMLSNVVGLAANLIYRGVRYIDIPTTLMSITDSVMSNKQAVNGLTGKNQFGTYYAPMFIWGDLKYTKSESDNHIKAALVEGIKNGFIHDIEILRYFSEMLSPGKRVDAKNLVHLAEKVILSKTTILEQDPTEKEYAVILEYGHTIGHAIEWLTKGRVMHGLAVAIGMCVEAEIAFRMSLIERDIVDLHYHYLEDVLGVSTELPTDLDVEKLIKFISTDNKRTRRGIGFVLLEGLGQCHNPHGNYLANVDEDILRKVLCEYQAGLCRNHPHDTNVDNEIIENSVAV